MFGFLEVGLGAYAAATPLLFDAILPLYRAVYLAAREDEDKNVAPFWKSLHDVVG